MSADDPSQVQRFVLVTAAGDRLEIEQRGTGVLLWAHDRPVARLTAAETRAYAVKVLLAFHEARDAETKETQ